MRPLRFCMVTTFYPPYHFGGDGIAIQRLSQALVRRGHHVTVLQDVDGFNVLRPGPEPVRIASEDGVEVVRLRTKMPLLSALLTQQAGRPVLSAPGYRRFFAGREFDVINFHNVSLAGGPAVFSMGDGVKLYMAHDHWLVCPTHVLWRHAKERCTGRECIRCSIAHRRPPQPWRYTGLLERHQRHVDTFIALSEFSRDKHREFGFARPMEVVGFFLPDGPTQRTCGVAPHPRPYFLFVGRLERIKGLDDVIPLFARRPDADLLVAGEGEHEPALRALASGNERVRFLGRVDPVELDRYYAHALALVVPSVCFETFGMVLIEAFRQGTPVLARRVGPFPEIVARGGGLLFDGPVDLALAMARIQCEPALRGKLSEEARRSFLANWSEGAVVPRYLDVVRRAALARGRQDVVSALEAPQGMP